MNAWALIMIGLTLIIMVVVPGIGLYLFKPHRARAVKQVEEWSVHTAEQVAELRRLGLYTLARRHRRLDRHPAYLVSAAYLWAYAWVVMFVHVPYASLGAEALGTRHTLAISLLMGSTMILGGAILGSHVGGRCVGTWVCSNTTSSALGDDVRIPYCLAWGGLASTMISMGFYAYTVIASAGAARFFTTLGGFEAVMVATTCVVMIPKFITRIRQYMEEREAVLFEARTVIAEQDSA